MQTILLVDDEAPLRQLLRLSLEAGGYEVLSAGDGLEAVRVGREQLGRLDLVITDVCMPGIEGPEVAQQLREIRGDLKVLLITGNTDRILSGPLLRKPFAPAELLDRVREMLDPSDVGGGLRSATVPI
jgi:CheY-like chemotaxis protein